jgi:hypothetical protein
MSEKKYCELCNCTSHSDMPKHLKENWACPLLGGKNICEVDCHFEVSGGMGAPDTLRQVMTLSGKSAWEVRQACIACPKGGKKLEHPPEIVAILGKDGKRISSGQELERAQKRCEKEWRARLEMMKDPKYPWWVKSGKKKS